MHLIILHKDRHIAGNSNNMLQFAFSADTGSDIFLNGINKHFAVNSASTFSTILKATPVVTAIPDEWNIAHLMKKSNNPITDSSCSYITYRDKLEIPANITNKISQKQNSKSWFVISNGRFVTKINNTLLEYISDNIKADIIAINTEPEFLSNKEKIRLTSQGNVAGFRRLYSDSYELAPIPSYWPHHLLINTNLISRIFVNNVVPSSFDVFVKNCRAQNINLLGINIGGTCLDLASENGLLTFYLNQIENNKYSKFRIPESCIISKESRLIGKVLVGENVRIDTGVIILGPAIIGNNTQIEQNAAINSSIIGSNVCISKNHYVHNQIITCNNTDIQNPNNTRKKTFSSVNCDQNPNQNNTYRIWPRFSYVRCWKRIADIIVSSIVILLFAPLIPFFAIIIKLTSPGPVFFTDKRQGQHGKNFYCLKFRTMISGADKIQEKLRAVSHVDGPQFKIVNDPRINSVGRFLRDTYIDEIPQFLNVLLGQMSLVGPRPSPETENTVCPYWRDARLSVRPGITGLWQIRRTRQRMRDFQEWIHYDTEYVRKLSWRMDLWICWQTAKKMFDNFLRQF